MHPPRLNLSESSPLVIFNKHKSRNSQSLNVCHRNVQRNMSVSGVQARDKNEFSIVKNLSVQKVLSDEVLHHRLRNVQ